MVLRKTLVVNLLKILLVAGLLYWMASSGKLSFSQMALVFRRSDALVASIAVWLAGPVLLGTWRWWLLMRGAGLECKFLRALQLQVIGFFFNTAMPGAVGGDIVKAIYIMRDQTGTTSKTPAMLSVLLDRIVGLIGLFVMGAVAAALSFDSLTHNPVISQLVYGLAGVFACSIVFLAFIFISYKDGKDPIQKVLSLKIPGFSIVSKIYHALRSYKDRPKIIFGTIGISVIIQSIYLLFMGFIGRILYGVEAFDSSLLAPVYPFGILVTAIPLAPGGFGVGHAAFDKLFTLVGLPGGANVFNVYILSQLFLNLFGVIPYLSVKGKHVSFDADKVPSA